MQGFRKIRGTFTKVYKACIGISRITFKDFPKFGVLSWGSL